MKLRFTAFLITVGILLSPTLIAQEADQTETDQTETDQTEAEPTTEELREEIEDLKLRLEEIEAMAQDYENLQKQVTDLQTAMAETQPRIRPDISASATASWEYNLRTGRTGFLNEIDVEIEVPIIPDDSAREKTSRGAPRGYIKVEGYSLAIEPDDVQGSFGTIDARIYFDPYFVRLFRMPSALLNTAEAIDSNDVDIATRGTNVPMQGGFSVGYVDRTTTLEYKLGSATDQTLNENNQYGTAVYLKQQLFDGVFEYQTGVAYAIAFGNPKLDDSEVVSRDIGFGFGPTLNFRNIGYGLTFSAGFDTVRSYNDLTGEYDDFELDTRADAQVKISQRYSVDGEDAWSSINFGSYFRPDMEGSDHRLDLTASIDELEDDKGLLRFFGGSIGGTITDVLDDYGWSTKATASFRTSKVKPYVETEYGSSEILTLETGTEIYLISDVVFDVNYKSDNLNHEPTDEENPGDKGIIGFSVTIEY